MMMDFLTVGVSRLVQYVVVPVVIPMITQTIHASSASINGGSTVMEDLCWDAYRVVRSVVVSKNCTPLA